MNGGLDNGDWEVKSEVSYATFQALKALLGKEPKYPCLLCMEDSVEELRSHQSANSQRASFTCMPTPVALYRLVQ